MMSDVTCDSEPLGRDALFRLVGPLVGVTLAWLLSSAAPDATPEQAGLIMKAAALIAATVAIVAFAPWNRLPRSLQAMPPMSYLLVAFLLAETADNGTAYTQVALLPVVWLALYGTDGELCAGLIAVTVVVGAPLLMPGAGHDQWSRAFFLSATAWILGFAVHRVFGEMRAHTSRLQVLVREDALTSVGNRRAWDVELQDALGVAARRRDPLSVAMLDLDRFKDYNDAEGHQAGDRLLKEVTATWEAELRATDFLARLGGDEFAVILPGCLPDAAGAVAERLCASLPAGVTCSAGVAAWDGLETPQGLTARADAALYRAKAAGRDRVDVVRWASSTPVLPAL